MLRRAATAGLMLGLLAACTQPELATDPSAPGPSDACGASKLQKLFCTPLGSMDVKVLPSAPRQIGPDMTETNEYKPTRLNIEYDAKNTITKVSCF